MNSATGRGTILITGASSGLGEEMARQFADLGYDLGLCARRVERLEALKAEIARVEAHINRAQAHRSAADELFRK